MEQRLCVHIGPGASGIVVLLTVLGNPRRFTPGVQFLIHANITGSFEVQIRRQQIVYDPTTGNSAEQAIPRHTATAGLEWVY
jgi:hypothetical protein